MVGRKRNYKRYFVPADWEPIHSDDSQGNAGPRTKSFRNSDRDPPFQEQPIHLPPNDVPEMV